MLFNHNYTMANREYISVLFEEKEDAKSLGAKWDGEKRQWYIPDNINETNKFKLQKKYKTNNEPILELIGEDRTFGGNELFVDLIPSSCWFTNVRYCIRPSDWYRVRNFVYERVNYICECCGINTKLHNIQLDAHERWFYDNKIHTQKLVRIVALCYNCHQTTHMGLAAIKGKKYEAMKHLQTIRNFTEDECNKHIDEAFKVWSDRCKFEWTLDISLIENNGITLSNKVNKNDRQNICIKKLESILPVKEESFKIERYYPNKKNEKSYLLRYDNFVFEKFNEMNANIELQNDYKKWKDGINYKTNRKIKIEGKIHTELKQKFMINYGFSSVLFEDLNNINIHEYLQETKKINNEIDCENTEIKRYNVLVDIIIEKINKLNRWYEFVEFEGKKYGIIYKIKDNIHIENDCFGEMIFTHKKTTYRSNDRPFCICDDTETTYLIYNCCKCNYENKIIESITGGDIHPTSKCGFWWKNH